ncbi:MAG: peptide MFS transporter [Pirellulaceae bacterium]|jgi:POT family proton-dependent oligopeptide transporter|nr:peptide MFS transporter [Pirellulaceae bacterium]
MKDSFDYDQQGTLFGHPAGLFTLFFAEMWERFSYYGMRSLLVFYMLKGFLGYGDSQAYEVYGAYTSLVYMTPFFGGIIADRILGSRLAVVWGGFLMAAGHGLMGLEHELAFFPALALLIAGNGFFKPNISTMVGALYPASAKAKRDGGFTIFYMGINLGAAMSPLLCGYIGETYGWHKGFGLATIGMLAGIAVFVAPTVIAQLLVGLGALGGAYLLFFEHPDNPFSTAVNIFVMLALLGSAIASCLALNRGGLPKAVGGPPDKEVLKRHGWKVIVATIALIPIISLFVSGFSMFTADGKSFSLISSTITANMESSASRVIQILAVVVDQVSKPAGLILMLAGLVSFAYLMFETLRLNKVPRERMFVAFILIFFSMLFWSFFEQAGSSITNFTDRNVDRVFAKRIIGPEDIGKTLQIQPTQEQLGYFNGEQQVAMDALTKWRNENEDNPGFTIQWTVVDTNQGMEIAERVDEIPASTFQSVNPIFILVFGLVFAWLWTSLGRFEPSAPFKFALGLLQLGIGFLALWYGAQTANDRGMVGLEWLFVGYLFHTTGELCLSPVGLSMMTRLSPKRLGSTVMGTWFLATAFSQYLAAIISQFTGISHGGGEDTIPIPLESVNVYGDVFWSIAIASMVSALICFALVPLMKMWMHEGEEKES